MSQKDLAAAVGVDDSYISLIEHGKRLPPVRVIEALADALQCSPQYLTTGLDEEHATGLRTTVRYAQIALENGEVDQALASFDEARADPDLSCLPGLVDETAWGHARALEVSGNLAAAVTALRRLVVGASPVAEPERWCELHIALVRCLRELGHESESIKVGEEALGEVTSTLTESWTDAMVMLGSTILAAYMARGDLVYARHLARQLVHRAETNGSPLAKMAAYWNAGEAALTSGDAEEALRLATNALAMLGEMNDPRNMGRLRTAYGYYLLSARPGEAGLARRALRQAELELADSSASVIDMAWCLTSAARAELLLGHAAEAAELAEHSVDLLADAEGQALAEAYTVLGDAYVRLRRYDAAATALDHAARYLTTTGQEAAQAWYDMADVRGAAGDDDGQAAALRQAMACMGV